MIGWLILALLACFIATILIRAALFQPKEIRKREANAISLESREIINNFIALIQCRTVSDRDETKVEWGEFERFQNELKNRYPNIHQQSTLTHHGKSGLLYYLKGESDVRPSVCMAHYDVVPVVEEQWKYPPFSGHYENGEIWGRGTLDTKGTLCALLEALEQLLREGYIPKNDLYLSFSGEEEIDGNSCPEIVAYLNKIGVKPDFVLDEGGAVVSNVFPGVTEDCALIGTGEKGSVNLQCMIPGSGGHSSAPPAKSTARKMAQIIKRIEKHPFSTQFTSPVLEMYDSLGRYSPFGLKIIFANMWCFRPLFGWLCKKLGGELNAMVRTTCAITRWEGSKAYNVLPEATSLGMNLRLLGKDTVESVMKHLEKSISDSSVKMELMNGMNPSIYSDTACDAYQTLYDVIADTWPGVIVSPYLMMARSDSGHYCKITNHVYRFSGMRLSAEERRMIHGTNERIPEETLLKTVEFYLRLLKRL